MEMDTRYPNLSSVQNVIDGPQSGASGVADAGGTVTRVAVGFPQNIVKALLLCRLDIRAEGREVASDGGLRHQVLQKPTISGAERAAVMMLRYAVGKEILLSITASEKK